MDESEKKELMSVIDSGWFTEAKKTRKFEKMFADFIGCKYACAVTSGTAGLQLALTALNISVNDEVIVPVPYWVSLPEQVKLSGGVPVYQAFAQCIHRGAPGTNLSRHHRDLVGWRPGWPDRGAAGLGC